MSPVSTSAENKISGHRYWGQNQWVWALSENPEVPTSNLRPKCRGSTTVARVEPGMRSADAGRYKISGHECWAQALGVGAGTDTRSKNSGCVLDAQARGRQGIECAW